MNKLILFASLPLAALFTQVHAAPMSVPQGEIVTDAAGGGSMTYAEFYTESAWQSVVIPVEVAGRLGDLQRLQLSVQGLPSNVHAALMPEESLRQVGFRIWRLDRSQRVDQVGLFTLTNPVNHFSYTFQATVLGASE
ncbi:MULTISPECIES: hypothetical protein [Deinococcus]|uniref:Uncharacterized protein n=1 Tax=Deinococcus rufus TaxID=2136097 RepID=A0ABV7Z626_9DEIO|nr:hypothetical protein [Deinococcus sp. AB2017081]WQE97193.1 hypothetical protein U2P90_19170 [Deinococcus sp. AB2017081]